MVGSEPAAVNPEKLWIESGSLELSGTVVNALVVVATVRLAVVRLAEGFNGSLFKSVINCRQWQPPSTIPVRLSER
ncbi:hypothetical protein J1614_012084 [Plenodomus biglobosus]|nr:hypothetical protein J1614_012084 [Plenodomus biglobosus]